MQLLFSRLWGADGYWIGDREYGGNRASESFKPLANDTEAKAARDFAYYQMRKAGVKARRSCLRGQLRQYWSFGVPCGESCDVYMIDVPAGVVRG